MRFMYDGHEYTGREGDTLASALLANGVRTIGLSPALGRPRGIFSAGAEEPNAVVQIEEPFPEPMLPATMIELHDGLVARPLIDGRGRLATSPDTARYDAVNAHCDVLVVGAGPAGLSAALAAGRAGERVILADEQPALGGSLLSEASPSAFAASATEELAALTEVRVLSRTTVFGYYDDNYLMAVERRTNHLGAAAPAQKSRERVWRIRAGRVVLATGAHERSIAFAGNDLPGVMLLSAARTYAHRYGVLPGRRAVVLTTNDSAYPAVSDLRAAGLEVAAVVDVRNDPGIRFAALGTSSVNSVTVGSRGYAVDLVLVSGGWNPVVHLFSQSGGTLRYDSELATLVPDASRQKVTVVGSAAGEVSPSAAFWSVADADPDASFVDLQRDVTLADVRRAVDAGLQSVEHVKRYTTAGTAHDQGKTGGLLTSALVAHFTGRQIGGVTSFRAPYTPVSFAALAGRDRGMLYDPVRVTALHPWHVSRGALFENVGQWKRPWYYPLPGEDMETAVLRECTAARTSVAAMDASTLGKIDVIGPDAGAFLDLLYTNMMSTLRVGSCRYGVMCKADGMIFDDGTVARIADDHYLMTTTTGNAAPVLDWMEEWLQTEWPSLRVTLTSVTDQWSTVALVGPGSRTKLAALTPSLDVEAFPFMTWRDATVAGIPARVCRISFSGELAYEINVSSWYGLSLWESVMADGDVTPYGTETMHVLRAEKGFPIIGQDTDGTVTPQDLGLAWAISAKKPDFIGKRSFARADTARPDRKHLVGILPEDPTFLLPEGAALVNGELLGHVTSSYRSAALGRTFALALVTNGRNRIGERLVAPLGEAEIPVTVTSHVFYDPEGARRDG